MLHFCENGMAQHFLVRNRHQNNWYGRVIISLSLRTQFCDRREIQRSLKTNDRSQAKKSAMRFWLQCQDGFEQLKSQSSLKSSFQRNQDFFDWLSYNHEQTIVKNTTKTNTRFGTAIPFYEAADHYYLKIQTQGEKRKRLEAHTLLGYQSHLAFWKAYFGDRSVDGISNQELFDIQQWITWLPVNYHRKGISTKLARYEGTTSPWSTSHSLYLSTFSS